jgi:hypothetical protein
MRTHAQTHARTHARTRTHLHTHHILTNPPTHLTLRTAQTKLIPLPFRLSLSHPLCHLQTAQAFGRVASPDSLSNRSADVGVRGGGGVAEGGGGGVGGGSLFVRTSYADASREAAQELESRRTSRTRSHSPSMRCSPLFKKSSPSPPSNTNTYSTHARRNSLPTPSHAPLLSPTTSTSTYERMNPMYTSTHIFTAAEGGAERQSERERERTAAPPPLVDRSDAFKKSKENGVGGGGAAAAEGGGERGGGGDELGLSSQQLASAIRRWALKEKSSNKTSDKTSDKGNLRNVFLISEYSIHKHC